MAVEIIIRGKDETGRAFEGVASSVRKIGDEAQSAGGRLRGFLDGVKNVALGAGVAIGGALAGIGAAGLGLNNSMEQAGARIQAFTKDSAATADILEMVRQRAAATPFAFNDMATAAASLLPAAKASGKGLEELIAQAEILAASNPAEGLEGAAFALKEALSGDFTSIIERFNLPRQRLNELKEQGVPALEAIQIAMQELGLDTDLVTGLANTAEGRWSTFMDTLQGLASQLTQPIFDAFSSGLGQVQSQIDANMPTIQAFAAALAGQIGAAIQWLIGTGIPMLITGWQNIQPALATAQALFSQVAGVVMTVAGVIIANLPAALATGQAAFVQAQGIIEPVMAGIMAVVSAVLPVITAFWAENGASILATVGTVWNQIVAIITVVAQIIGQVLQIIGGFIAAHGTEIVAYLTTAWNLISSIVTGALNLIQGIVTAALQLLKGDFSGAWDTIKETAHQFAVDLVAVIESAATLLGQAIDLGIAAIKDAWAALMRGAPGLGGDLIQGIIQGISNGVGALKSAITSAANAALDAAKKALGIESPSRVFAEMVGLPMAQGMAAGAQRGMPLVAGAGASLATAAVAGAQAARVEVGGRVDIGLSMRGDLDQMIDAKVESRLDVLARSVESRRRGG